jgi:hypothetical protein
MRFQPEDSLIGIFSSNIVPRYRLGNSARGASRDHRIWHVFVHPWLRDLHDPPDGFLPDDGWEAESDVSNSSDEAEAKSDAGSCEGSDPLAPASLLQAEPTAQVDSFFYSGAARIALHFARFNGAWKRGGTQ